MACRTTGLNWIMWSRVCPVLRQPHSVNSRAEQSVTIGSETRPKPRSLVLLGTDHHSQGKHDERLRNVIRQTGRQYTASYPHTHTLNGLLHICGLWWTEMECTEDCLKEVISAELLASLSNPNLQKNNIINQSSVPRSQSNAPSPVRSAVSLFTWYYVCVKRWWFWLIWERTVVINWV